MEPLTVIPAVKNISVFHTPELNVEIGTVPEAQVKRKPRR